MHKTQGRLWASSWGRWQVQEEQLLKGFQDPSVQLGRLWEQLSPQRRCAENRQLFSISNEGTGEETDKLKRSFQLNKKKRVLNMLIVSMEIFLWRPLEDTHLYKEEDSLCFVVVKHTAQSRCTVRQSWAGLYYTKHPQAQGTQTSAHRELPTTVSTPHTVGYLLPL